MIINDCVFEAKRYWAPFGSPIPPTGWADISRYGNDMVDGAGVAEPDWVQLPSGMWVKEFDGNDYGTIAYYPNGENITVGHWINYTTIQDQVSGVNDGANHRMYIGIEVSGDYFFAYGDTAKATTPSGIAAGTWYFMVMTTDGTNAVLYINGTQVDTLAFTFAGLSTQPFAWGAMKTAGFASYEDSFKGLPFIYKYTMNPVQINEKYASERHWFDGA